MEHLRPERRIAFKFLAALVFGVGTLLDASAALAQGWQPVEPMPIARSYHGGATIGDRWYVAGGATWFGTGSGDPFPAEVDVYDPTSGHWTALGNLAQGRQFLPAIADPSQGRVLFPGGFLPAGPFAYLPLGTCDIAASDGVHSGPSLLRPRHLHAVALAAGKVVVSGGRGDGAGGTEQLMDDAETWDGTSAGWTAAGRMPGGMRAGHTMTTLKNGHEILVVGGSTSNEALKLATVFDASCGTWSTAPAPTAARVNHKAVLLTDGRVLVAGGGSFPTPPTVLSSVELFDPGTGEWTLAASMHDARFDFGLALLPDGRVLAVGGSNNSGDGEFGALASAEVYDPAADTWTLLPPMHDRRRLPALAVLSDGVYVAGGSFALTKDLGSVVVLASVERLPWSELGIAGPVDLDAGAPGEPPPDASPTCGSDDGGPGRDAESEGGEHDGGLDAQPDAASDAPVNDGSASDGKTSAGSSGCSCSLREVGEDWPAGLAFACIALGAAFRRRVRG